MKQTKQYRRKLRKLLTCSRKDRAALLKRFDGMADRFLEDNASPSYDQIEEAFGPAEELASSLLDTLDAAALLRHQKRRRMTRTAAAVFLGLLFALTILGTAVGIYNSLTPIESSGVIVVIEDREGGTTTLPEPEAAQ